jgi:hypothetical protein
LTVLYELAVLGSPTNEMVVELENCVKKMTAPFCLSLGNEIGWKVRPESFTPSEMNSAAAVFFGARNASLANFEMLLRRGIPILPVVSDINKAMVEIPTELHHLNCLAYSQGGVQRIATALLECAGLLPRQRRVFLSYRRDEARQAALQLFEALSARQFDVFLDTHGIAPAEDFQAMLWHRLCDSDVLVMLDTPNYFGSRWTSAEFGRALAKGISVLRVGWPDSTPSVRTGTASRAELVYDEVDPMNGRLKEEAITRICLQLEAVRSQSCAVRNLNLVSNIRNAIEQLGGQVAGVGMNKAVYVRLPDGRDVVVYPAVGVPTSMTLHDATTNAPNQSVAVVFDSIGLHPNWLEHLDWLGSHVRGVRWVKASEAAWQFAAWEA